ncbi:unnamed protein product [Kluyveromyces dobzhanskii CBS 2104]|uniref:WGS project CCBQ000000000 data, contig 00098 n=1 Tax=Kluyveromyces dobzhanskii CBS 2104 TaxID=1427455 RepID=A0A0A8L5D9_9SACH|nr:unnamed protein product [Kluyveromyces dobzhanskii CBS 2104]
MVAVKDESTKQEISECFSPNTVYYPKPITFKRANEFNNGKRVRPLDSLADSIYSSAKKEMKKEGYQKVVHWFRGDLRVHDNTGLAFALNHSSNGPVEALYTINEHDWIAHMESGWKLKFQLDAVESLSQELAKIGVRLHVKQFNPTSPCLSNSHQFAEWFANTVEEIAGDEEPTQKRQKKETNQDGGSGVPNTLVTANVQYEVDELYRDVKIADLQAQDNSTKKFTFQLFHDQCVVVPGTLKTGKGSQYTIFTPWYKKWVSFLEDTQKDEATICSEASIPRSCSKETCLEPEPIEYRLPDKFTSYIPQSPLDTPKADEATAMQTLQQFLAKRAAKYNDEKDLLELTGTSLLSCYVTSGVISTRTIVQHAYLANNKRLMNKDIKKNNSLETYIKEVAWRDFYKHVITYWPFLSMDLPFKFETLDIRWENDVDQFEKWCYGKTGFPIVDAIMQKMLHTGYINNRSRMITASFLAKNLLVDWRWGERWFRKHLIDYDVASNVGGWGFCASTGVDCQPYFRVFNMTLQSQKYDPDGKFIKHWLKLDRATKKGIHEPGPDAIVDLKHSRERALERFREVM